MCQPVKESRHMSMAGCTCGSCGCGCGPYFRRFYSSEEQRERMESYRDQLKKELAGVEERIGDLER
jgi:hypothetical protein